VSLHEVAQEIEFVAGVRQGLAEIERGERIPFEDIVGELPSKLPLGNAPVFEAP